ncbi:MAG: hypothetical protein ACNI27_00650 [Desulfovibrio sp.]
MPVVVNDPNVVMKAADVFKTASEPTRKAAAAPEHDQHPANVHVIHENADPRVGEQIVGAHSFNLERVAALLSDPLLDEDF